jgi:uncharacterized protein (TIGR02421 family)
MTGTFDTCRLEVIIRDLEANSGIDFPIGTTGRLYIERKLPFLLVYRTPADSGDEVIRNLVKNEASYLICPEKLYFACRLMILKIIQTLADEYGAFLLVEIWSGEMSDLSEMHAAGFDLFGPASQLPQSITSLKENVRKIDLAGLAPKITLNVTDRRCPDHLEPLLNKKELKQLECLLLGLKVDPFYRSPETGQIYPVLERRLYAGFGEVFRKSVYDFIKVQGTHKLSGFQSLARREVNPETWQVDRQLVDIDSQIHFLLLVSPVNTDGAWKEFQKSHFGKPPAFRYRMLPIDPEILKRNLFNLPIEKIDDPTLGFLFRDKRNEIDKMLNMLKSRNTEDFLYNGVLLFGTVQPWLLDAAKEIVETYPVSDASAKEGGTFYTAEEFATLAKQELVYLQKQWPGVSSRIEIKDSVTDLMVNKGILSIPLNARIPVARAHSLIQHEIGTHVLTYYNGKNQPLQLLCSGIPGYEELQEGIAVLTEYLTSGLTVSRMQILAARVIAVDSMIRDRNFITTFELLADGFKFSKEKSFYITTRVYRSGGFAKDAVYLKGLIRLIQYLKEGNPLESLLIGKIQQSYLSVVEELIVRKILRPAEIRPRYLTDETALQRLAGLKNIEKITDLVN